jgi:hypothetical protein
VLNLDASWVWPYWLERQLDPASADFVAGSAGGAAGNLTHRSGMLVGNVATYERALIDPRGLVTPFDGGWSLDWWIGAEDQWHVPSRVTAVRQRLLHDAPVLETAMRVPGGDALQRAYAMQSTALGPCVVIELENRTAVPYAVAISVRPYNVLGLTSVDAIALDGARATVDGSDVLFSKEPAHALFATAAEGDVAAAVFAGRGAGEARADAPSAVHDREGRATAAFLFPLPHTAIFRVVVPLGRAAAPRRSARGSRVTAVAYPDAVPSAEQVAKGWEIQTRRGLQVELPDNRLQETVDIARRHLLLAHAGEDLVSWPAAPFDFATAATVLGALDAYGFHEEAAQVLDSWPERQTLDGGFVGTPDRVDANGAALLAVAEHWRLTRDNDLIDRLIGPIAKGAHWIDKKRSSRRARREPGADGLLPTGAGPSWAAGSGCYLRDASIAVRGLARIADALEASGQPEVGEDSRRFATELRSALDRSIAASGRAGDGDAPADIPAIPALAGRPLDDRVVANLDLIEPHGELAADDPRAAATIAHIIERDVTDRGVFQRAGAAGLSPALTMKLASIEIAAGDPVALDRLAWMLERGGVARSWPSVMHPTSGGGSAGSPQDAEANAHFLLAVRNLLVRETADGAGLVLLSLVPPSWLGQNIDVREAPTAFGRCSYSIRWHGERPALLWEIEPHDGVDAVLLTVPSLDPAWSSSALKGEALLGAVAAPDLGSSFT